MNDSKKKARYFAVGNSVWMRDTEGHESDIQNCASHQAAEKAAARWQKKEDAALAKLERP